MNKLFLIPLVTLSPHEVNWVDVALMIQEHEVKLEHMLIICCRYDMKEECLFYIRRKERVFYGYSMIMHLLLSGACVSSLLI